MISNSLKWEITKVKMDNSQWISSKQQRKKMKKKKKDPENVW